MTEVGRRSFPPVLLVALGGTVGTAARHMVGPSIPDLGRLPAGILTVNLVGCFLLGCLAETLSRRGDDTGRRRDARLLLGTGVIGGFTTYSALAVDTAALLRDDAVATAVLYAVGTVVLGAVAVAVGIAVGRRLPGPRQAS
ncbi:MAG: fluoride efflux transporter CrcB [Aeromicrobium sp.]|uniref:fluoride efflux transporter CrcB n=1 Tax=Aeromicrobium sp. TaxID=1871063 RepID=UPI0039E48269